jgi:serine/threonine protein phosphatase PrpC
MPVPLKIYCINELGLRKNNEDSIWPPLNEALLGTRLFLVCDGVGGNSKGEVASAMACKYFNEYFDLHLHDEDQLNEDFINEARIWVVAHFDEYISNHPNAADMSTTLTLAYLKKNSIFVAWCGDSRIHLVRNGEIVFQSEDHSLVNELLRRGNITPEEAVNHPHRNVITRSIQAKKPYAAIQTAEIFDVKPNDYLLLCSDGLLEQISPSALKELLTTETSPDLVEQFQQFCRHQTRDNYSMYLLKLMNLDAPVKEISSASSIVENNVQPPRSSYFKSIVLSLVLLFGLAGMLYYAYINNLF